MVERHLFSDKEIKRLAREGVTMALIHRAVLEEHPIKEFFDRAREIIDRVPVNTLREFCANTINSFTYGQTPLDILTQIEIHGFDTTARDTE